MAAAVQTYDLFLTSVDKFGPLLKIWGQTDRQTSLYIEQVLLEMLKQFDQQTYMKPMINNIHVGLMCCAKYKDGIYYRAQIRNINPNGRIEVRFIDYGNIELIQIDNIRLFDEKTLRLSTIPPQASEFILACVMHVNNDWDEQSLTFVHQEVAYTELKTIVLHNIHNLKLVKVLYRDTDLATYLTMKGLTVPLQLETQDLYIRNLTTPHLVTQKFQKVPELLSYKTTTLPPESEHMVYVSYVEDGPLVFSVQLQSMEATLEKLMADINRLQLEPLREPPIPGHPCMARCMEDDTVCRAVVVSFVGDKCKTYYVDFGNTDVLPLSNIYQIPPSYMLPRAMSMRFTLTDLKNLEVTNEMKCAFKDFVTNKLLKLKVKVEDSPLIQYCELYDNNKNVADILYDKPHQYRLLSLNKGQKSNVIVSYIEGCKKFFVQLKECAESLNSLMLALAATSESTPKLTELKPGLSCCAFYSGDNQWYRARIVSINSGNVTVKYVDYGNEETIPTDSVHKIDPQFVDILPAQAIECCLYGYQNMSFNSEIENVFESLTLECEFSMKVKSKHNNVLLVDLFDVSCNNVAALLIEKLAAQQMQMTSLPAQQMATAIMNDAGIENNDDKISCRNNENNNKTWRSNSFEKNDEKPRRTPDDNKSWKNQPDDNNKWRSHEDGNRSWKNQEDNNKSWRSSEDTKSWKNQPDGEKSWRGEDKKGSWRNNDDKSRCESVSQRLAQYRKVSHKKKREKNQWNDDSGGRGDSWENKPKRQQDRPRSRGENWTEKKPFNKQNSWGDDPNRKPFQKPERKFNKPDSWEDKKFDNKPDSWDDKKYNNTKTNLFDDKNRRKDSFDSQGSDRRRYQDRKPKNWEESDGKSFHQKKDFQSPKRDIPKSIEYPLADLNEPFPYREIEIGVQENVLISWFYNPQNFYIQCVSSQKIFRDMMIQIQDAYASNKKTLDTIPVGSSVIAEFCEDSILYRAIVLEQKGMKYKVQYIDFGNVGMVDRNKIYQVEKRFMELPIQGIRCCLENIKPVGDDWPISGSIDELFSKDSFVCVFDNIINDMYVVQLWDGDKELRSQLIENGFATDSLTFQMDGEPVDINILLGQTLRVNLCYIENLERFFIQVDPKKMTEIENVMNTLIKKETTLQKMSSEHILPELNCLFKSKDKWYRGTVIDSQDPENIFIICPDNGQQFDVKSTEIYLLPTELCVYWYQSIECGLHNLTNDSCRLFSDEDFKSNNENKQVIVYVDNIENGRLLVTLYNLDGIKLELFVPDDDAFPTVEKICPLPVFNSTISVYVSHVDKATSLYIQQAKDSDTITQLLQSLFEFYETDDQPEEENDIVEEPVRPIDIVDLTENMFCCAKSEDGSWYRAKVIKIEDDNVRVQYIDYGNTEVVPKSHLKALDERFQLQNELALNVSLGLTETCPEFKEHFMNITQDKELKAVIYYDNGWIVELFDGDNNINKVMVESDLIGEIVTCGEAIPVNVPEDEIEKRPAILVSHSDSPGEFYVQLLTNSDDINRLQEELNGKIDGLPNLEGVDVGSLCAAKYEIDERWYRAVVLDADDDITTVRFVDFGNTDVIDSHSQNIKQLPPELLSIDKYARKCSLNVRPLKNEWSPEACEVFNNAINVDVLYSNIVYQDGKNNTYVELYDGDGRNISDTLIELNYAETITWDVKDNIANNTGFVSHINTVSEFWIQLESSVNDLEMIAERLAEVETFSDLQDLSPGILCAALYPEDCMWYRGRILSNTVAGVEVLFIDYGNSSTALKLKVLPEDLAHMPALAQKCCLNRPTNVTEWNDDATERFQEISGEGATIFTIKKLSPGETHIVELFIDGYNIVEQLLQKRLTPIGQPQMPRVTIHTINTIEDFYVVDDTESRILCGLGVGGDETLDRLFKEMNDEGVREYRIEYLTMDEPRKVRLYYDNVNVVDELLNKNEVLTEEFENATGTTEGDGGTMSTENETDSIKNEEILRDIDENEIETKMDDDKVESSVDKEETIISVDKEETITSVDKEETITNVDKEETVTSVDKEETITSVDKEEIVTTVDKVEITTSVDKVETHTRVDKVETNTDVDKVETNTDVDKVETISGNNEEIISSNDKIESSPKDDKVESSPNDDKIGSSPSNDKIKSSPSNDKIESSPSDDKIESSLSNDKIQSSPSNDKIESSPSDDKVESSPSDDKVELLSKVDKTKLNSITDKNKTESVLSDTQVNEDVTESNNLDSSENTEHLRTTDEVNIINIYLNQISAECKRQEGDPSSVNAIREQLRNFIKNLIKSVIKNNDTFSESTSKIKRLNVIDIDLDVNDSVLTVEKSFRYEQQEYSFDDYSIVENDIDIDEFCNRIFMLIIKDNVGGNMVFTRDNETESSSTDYLTKDNLQSISKRLVYSESEASTDNEQQNESDGSINDYLEFYPDKLTEVTSSEVFKIDNVHLPAVDSTEVKFRINDYEIKFGRKNEIDAHTKDKLQIKEAIKNIDQFLKKNKIDKIKYRDEKSEVEEGLVKINEITEEIGRLNTDDFLKNLNDVEKRLDEMKSILSQIECKRSILKNALVNKIKNDDDNGNQDTLKSTDGSAIASENNDSGITMDDLKAIDTYGITTDSTKSTDYGITVFNSNEIDNMTSGRITTDNTEVSENVATESFTNQPDQSYEEIIEVSNEMILNISESLSDIINNFRDSDKNRNDTDITDDRKRTDVNKGMDDDVRMDEVSSILSDDKMITTINYGIDEGESSYGITFQEEIVINNGKIVCNREIIRNEEILKIIVTDEVDTTDIDKIDEIDSTEQIFSSVEIGREDDEEIVRDRKEIITGINEGLQIVTGDVKVVPGNVKKISSINEEITSTNEEIIASVDEITSTNEIFGSNKDISEANENISGVNGNISVANKNISEANKNISGANKNISGAKENISEANDNISGVKENISEANDNISGANENISGANENISGAKENISEANDNISGAKENISEANDNISGANDNISGANENISGAKENISEANDNISGANENISGANKNIFGTNEKKICDEITSTNEKVTSTNQDIISSNQEIASVSVKISSINKEKIPSDDANASNNKEMSSFRIEIASNNEEIASNNEEIASSYKNVAINNEISSTNEEISSTNQGNVTFGKKMIPTDEKTTSINIIASTSKEIASTRKEIASTRKEIPSTRKEIPSTRKEIPSTRKEIASNRKEIASTRKEIPSSNEEISTTNEEISLINKRVSSMVSSDNRSTEKLLDTLSSSNPRVGVSKSILRNSETASDTSSNNSSKISQKSVKKRVRIAPDVIDRSDDESQTVPENNLKNKDSKMKRQTEQGVAGGAIVENRVENVVGDEESEDIDEGVDLTGDVEEKTSYERNIGVEYEDNCCEDVGEDMRNEDEYNDEIINEDVGNVDGEAGEDEIDVSEERIEEIEASEEGIEANEEGIEVNEEDIEVSEEGIEASEEGIEASEEETEPNEDAIEANVGWIEKIEANEDPIVTNEVGIDVNETGIEANETGIEARIDEIEANKSGIDVTFDVYNANEFVVETKEDIVDRKEIEDFNIIEANGGVIITDIVVNEDSVKASFSFENVDEKGYIDITGGNLTSIEIVSDDCVQNINITTTIEQCGLLDVAEKLWDDTKEICDETKQLCDETKELCEELKELWEETKEIFDETDEAGNVEKETGNVEKEMRNVEKETRNVEKEMGNVEKKSGNVKKEIGNVEKKSGNVKKETGNVKKKSGNVEKKSGNVENKSCDVEKESYNIEKESSNVEKESCIVEKESCNVEKESYNVEKESSNVEKESCIVEKESYNVDKESYNVDKESSNVEKKSCIVETDSCNVDKESCNVEKESSNVEKESCNVDKESSNVDKESCIVEKESCNVDNESCNVKKESCGTLRKLFAETMKLFDTTSESSNVEKESSDKPSKLFTEKKKLFDETKKSFNETNLCDDKLEETNESKKCNKTNLFRKKNEESQTKPDDATETKLDPKLFNNEAMFDKNTVMSRGRRSNDDKIVPGCVIGYVDSSSDEPTDLVLPDDLPEDSLFLSEISRKLQNTKLEKYLYTVDELNKIEIELVGLIEQQQHPDDSILSNVFDMIGQINDSKLNGFVSEVISSRLSDDVDPINMINQNRYIVGDIKNYLMDRIVDDSKMDEIFRNVEKTESEWMKSSDEDFVELEKDSSDCSFYSALTAGFDSNEDSDKKSEGTENKFGNEESEKKSLIDGSEKKSLIDGSEKKSLIDGSEKKSLIDGSEKKSLIDGSEKKSLIDGSEKKNLIDRSEKKTLIDGSEKKFLVDAPEKMDYISDDTEIDDDINVRNDDNASKNKNDETPKVDDTINIDVVGDVKSSTAKN